jgi:hypothetical protein
MMSRGIVLVFLSALFNCFNSSAANRTASTVIDGVTYKATLNGDESLSIREGTKTVYYIKRADLYITFEKFAGLEFKDFNGDGSPDLIISYNSNIPAVKDLILYDKRTKKFVQVTNFSNYPASVRIPNTGFYYSYHPSGCADMDWDSDLYKITKYKIIPLGTISGKGCESSHEKLGIFIYKMLKKKERLIKTIPITALSQYNNNKQTFINNFWSGYVKLYD